MERIRSRNNLLLNQLFFSLIESLRERLNQSDYLFLNFWPNFGVGVDISKKNEVWNFCAVDGSSGSLQFRKSKLPGRRYDTRGKRAGCRPGQKGSICPGNPWAIRNSFKAGSCTRKKNMKNLCINFLRGAFSFKERSKMTISTVVQENIMVSNRFRDGQ